MSWMSGKSVPVPNRATQMKPMATSPAATISCSLQVDVAPTIFSRGDADLGRFLQGGPGRGASAVQEDPLGLGDLDPQPGRLLVEPWRLYWEVLHHKAVSGGLAVQYGNDFRAGACDVVDIGDVPALELLQAAHPLAEEPDLGRVLTPPVARG